MDQISQVYSALMSMRAPVTFEEQALHQLALTALADAGLEAAHEVQIAPRCRVDILSHGIGIEIKRGRPNKTTLLRQLTRYASSDKITGIIIVCEHGLSLPETLASKPVRLLSLNRLWGVAMPSGQPDADISQPMPARHIKAPQPFLQTQPTQPLDYVPAYLQPFDVSGHLYGTLSYNRQRRGWTIKGEPCVTELAKRLFPGSDKGRRGTAFFTANRRSVGDVNWLMQRYPLEISPKDLDRWQEQLQSARDHYQRLASLQHALPNIPLTSSQFTGTLRVFQQAGLNWLYQTPRGLLADEMGLGKTVQALANIAAQNAYPAMIVVPPHLVRNWQSEIQRFLLLNGRPPRVHVLKGLKPYDLPEADIYLMHYLLLRGWKQTLPSLPFRMVVFDEIQELRHGGTEKYSAASLLAESCERVIGLSGTPIYNHGGEIWNIVNILDFHMLGDWESFTREWCYGYGNAIVAKPDLLGSHLRREGVMLRRTKAEVLPELPDKRRLVQEIDADSSVYRAMMQPVLQNLMTLHENSELTPSERALLEGNISQGQRQATGLAKAPYVSQFVRALLDSGEKVLLFAHHHAVMDVYKKELRTLSPAFITGRETAAQKESSVERFMTGRTNLCCISLRAASGLNLQKATCVVFGELDWSPAVHSQAEDRAHRIGQKDSLLCYYLVSPEGSDADIQEALGLKVSQFLGLMGERPQGSEEVLQGAGYARAHVEKLMQRWLSARDTPGFSV
mgnify:CR=1 FL=1